MSDIGIIFGVIVGLIFGFVIGVTIMNEVYFDDTVYENIVLHYNGTTTNYTKAYIEDTNTLDSIMYFENDSLYSKNIGYNQNYEILTDKENKVIHVYKITYD